MFKENRKKEIFTIPNLLSLFRLALIPVYVTLYRQAVRPDQFQLAALILAVSCLTDCLDGFIARRYNMVTTLGKFLDPLADKVTQFTMILCLSRNYSPLRPVFLLFLIKETVQILLAGFHLHRGQILPGALAAGKICTTVLFLSLIMLVLFPGMSAPAVRSIALVDSFFLLWAFVCYLLTYLWGGRLLRDLKAE